MALKIWGPYQMAPVSTSLWLYMELTSETVNVSDNSSTVYFRLYLRKETGGNYNLSSGNNYSITVDGQTWSGDHGAITSGEIEILLYSGSKKVYHASDGSKTITLSGSFANKLGTGASTGSQSYTLTKIARTSAINSITNVTLDASSETSNGTVKFTPASSSYYYRFSYTIGTYTQAFNLGSGGSTSEVSRTFTIPNSVVSQISTGSISVIGTLETFTGQYTGSIGSTTKTFTVYVGSGYDPSMTSEMLYVDEFNEQALSGKTKIQTISSAVVSSGATISKYETIIANSGGTVQYGTEASYTSGPIASSGTYTVTVKVTDSRGKTASKTFTTKNFIAYTKPSIKPTATATRVRSTDDGYVVDESEGTVARITYEVVGYTTLVGNQKHVLVFDPITSNWTEIFDNPAYLGGYTIDSDFIFQIKVYDEITSIDDASAAITVSIGSAKFPMDFMPSGNGAAFGMVANKENTLETPWDIVNGETVISSSGIRVGQYNREKRFTYEMPYAAKHDGETGWIRLITFNIYGGYADGTMAFDICGRGYNGTAYLTLTNASSAANAGIDTFTWLGSGFTIMKAQVGAVANDKLPISIWVWKRGAYDSPYLAGFSTSAYQASSIRDMDETNVAFSSSEPSGTTIDRYITSRDIAFNSKTWGSWATDSKAIPTVAGYSPFAAYIIGGSTNSYTVQFICAITTGYVRVINTYSGSLTTSVNVRIWYRKD